MRTRLIYTDNFRSREVSLEEREILNCGDGLVPRRYGITGARERQREVQQYSHLIIN